jgi:hypothetical protein
MNVAQSRKRIMIHSIIAGPLFLISPGNVFKSPGRENCSLLIRHFEKTSGA